MTGSPGVGRMSAPIMTRAGRGCNRGSVPASMLRPYFDPGPARKRTRGRQAHPADHRRPRRRPPPTRRAAAVRRASPTPGLFPNTSAAKPAAQKCLADGLVRVVGTEAKGKTPRELYALTDRAGSSCSRR